tara:strand:+ start:13298 stop:13576 length:279 start_codon:yes stop_codon:yes gene_type:complete
MTATDDYDIVLLRVIHLSFLFLLPLRIQQCAALTLILTGLFSDAKLRKDLSQQVVGRHGTNNLSETLVGQSQLFGDNLHRLPLLQTLLARSK